MYDHYDYVDAAFTALSIPYAMPSREEMGRLSVTDVANGLLTQVEADRHTNIRDYAAMLVVDYFAYSLTLGTALQSPHPETMAQQLVTLVEPLRTAMATHLHATGPEVADVYQLSDSLAIPEVRRAYDAMCTACDAMVSLARPG